VRSVAYGNGLEALRVPTKKCQGNQSHRHSLVLVRLKSQSEFGCTIAFMPTLGAGILTTLGSESVVEELRDLAKKASTR
jgi:hypothetical protein